LQSRDMGSSPIRSTMPCKRASAEEGAAVNRDVAGPTPVACAAKWPSGNGRSLKSSRGKPLQQFESALRHRGCGVTDSTRGLEPRNLCSTRGNLMETCLNGTGPVLKTGSAGFRGGGSSPLVSVGGLAQWYGASVLTKRRETATGVRFAHPPL
jgi:hypothetical protein